MQCKVSVITYVPAGPKLIKYLEDLWLSFATDSKDPTNRYGFTWPKDQLASNTIAVFATNWTFEQLGPGADLLDWQCYPGIPVTVP